MSYYFGIFLKSKWRIHIFEAFCWNLVLLWKFFCTCLSACFEIHVLWSKIIFLLPIGWGFKESNLFSEIYEVDTKALICFERDHPHLYQKSRQLIAKYTLIIYLIHECREENHFRRITVLRNFTNFIFGIRHDNCTKRMMSLSLKISKWRKENFDSKFIICLVETNFLIRVDAKMAAFDNQVLKIGI